MRRDLHPVLGVDIGTTSISVVAIDPDNGTNLFTENMPHNASLPPDIHSADLQDPLVLLAVTSQMIKHAEKLYPNIKAIGITGQMHGIIPVDRTGAAVGPVYTWLDGRLNDLADTMAKEIGSVVPAGYGAGTLFALLRSGTIDPRAISVADVPAWIASRLTGNRAIVTSAGLAHSIGFFSIERAEFSPDEWNRIGDISPPIVRRVATFIGESASGIPICVPEGDNQTSFLSTIRDPERAVSFNIGTSGQVSLIRPAMPIPTAETQLEERPFPGGQTLLVGASLSGGKSFDLLADLVREIMRIGGAEECDPFSILTDLRRPTHPPVVDTRFVGTRRNPQIRGTISGIGLNNFTLAHLYWGFAAGVIDELYEMLGDYRSILDQQDSYIAVSGNALERSTAAHTLLAERVDRPLRWPAESEAAARGAAILAAAAAEGGVEHLPEIQARTVHYR